MLKPIKAEDVKTPPAAYSTNCVYCTRAIFFGAAPSAPEFPKSFACPYCRKTNSKSGIAKPQEKTR